MADSIRERRNWFLCLQLIFQVVLMVSTWPLWTISSSFPAVPLFGFLAPTPLVVDGFLSIILIGACVLAALNIALRRITKFVAIINWTALLSALSLAALNQHRLQPWHWLFILTVAQFVTLRNNECRRVNRVTVGSIYIFAGLSRLGVHAADGMSRQILSLALTTIGLQELLQNEAVVYWSCISMTVMEVLVGCLLLNPRTRRTGIVLAVLMHFF